MKDVVKKNYINYNNYNIVMHSTFSNINHISWKQWFKNESFSLYLSSLIYYSVL